MEKIVRVLKFCLFAFICIGLIYSIIKADSFYIILFSLSFLSCLYLMAKKIKNNY